MKNKIINIVLIIVLILVFVLGGLLAYRNIKQEKIIKNELEVINSLNASTDTINMEIKASGDYGKVEKAIKEYYTNYFVNKKIFNDNRVEALFNTLTVSYLKENKSKLKSLKLDKIVDDTENKILEIFDKKKKEIKEEKKQARLTNNNESNDKEEN